MQKYAVLSAKYAVSQARRHDAERREMLGTEVMPGPGRLHSSLRFIDIKTLCFEKFASHATNLN